MTLSSNSGVSEEAKTIANKIWDILREPISRGEIKQKITALIDSVLADLEHKK